MRLLSVNVGLPRRVTWRGKTVTTAIFKEPVEGRIRLQRLNLDGDRQADLSVHGGPAKAVYAYPAEHYPYWREQLPDRDLSWGTFGENLTIEGLSEDTVRIGDRFRMGTAELVVTQPRLPCFKLGIRFGDPGMVKRFLASRRTGFYLTVLEEGDVGAGDPITQVSLGEAPVTVADITRLYVDGGEDIEGLQRAVRVEALPEDWRDYFRERLARIRS
ncbi:MAG TPA: MOSC domain-containing protein [Candidatus Methylomirabilis sp.]|nr:MOSC domain-containing protein [Candidatus Methylomirabilis sp.]